MNSAHFKQRKIQPLECKAPPPSETPISEYTHPKTIMYPYYSQHDSIFQSEVTYYGNNSCHHATDSVESLFNSELPFVAEYDRFIQQNTNLNNKKDKQLYEHVESLKISTKFDETIDVGDWVLVDSPDVGCYGVLRDMKAIDQEKQFLYQILENNNCTIDPIDTNKDEMKDVEYPRDMNQFKISQQRVSLFKKSDANETFGYNYLSFKNKLLVHDLKMAKEKEAVCFSVFLCVLLIWKLLSISDFILVLICCYCVLIENIKQIK